jgi:hypothetical protein
VYRPAAAPTLQQRPAPPVYRPNPTAPALQRRAAPPVYRPVPPAPRRAAAIQPYFVIPANRIFSSEDQIHKKIKSPVAVIGGQRNFPSQVKVGNDFLEEGSVDSVNLSVKQAADLRVSDDGEMAIQDSDLSVRQPKTFYASATVFSNSQQQLQNAGSNLELMTTDKQLTIHLDDTRVKTLNQVIPKNGGDSYLKYTAPQNCQNMATYVTGQRSDTRMVTPSGQAVPGFTPTVIDEIHYAIAEYVAKQLGTSTSKDSRFDDAILGPLDKTGPDDHRKKQAVDAIAKDYVDALKKMNQTDVQRELKALRINEYAIASVGQAYVTHTIAEPEEQGKHQGKITDLETGRKFTPQWAYHFAAVVARSGNDTVTMENYARGGEGTLGNVGADPRWYFQMYGGGEGQSFHEASIRSGGFANPMTMVLQAPPPPGPTVVPGPVAQPSNFFVNMASATLRFLGLI